MIKLANKGYEIHGVDEKWKAIAIAVFFGLISLYPIVFKNIIEILKRVEKDVGTFF